MAWLALVLVAAVLCLYAPSAAAQGTTSTSSSSSARPTSVSPAIVPLGGSISAALPVNADRGFIFELAPSELPLTLSLSLCAGPAIASYNTSNTTLLRTELGLSATAARRSTLPRIFISLDPGNKAPAPGQGAAEGWVEGGVGVVQLLAGDASDGAWISLWPPADTRDVTSGTWSVEASAASDDSGEWPHRSHQERR